MEWTECISNAIRYIEDNITEKLTIEDIAKKAMVSPFYFEKGFTMLCGYTVGEYIKKRRLTLAGSELVSTKKKIIDIALKYGYDSPDSFTKAFIRFHNVIWWCSDFDNEGARSTLQTKKPYKTALEIMGIFATRSPIRPNPIALTPVEVISIDHQKGLIQIAYIDANDDTPVLDLKPYTPSYDRVDYPSVPEWCSHWPKSLEESGDFDWENVFNF